MIKVNLGRKRSTSGAGSLDLKSLKDLDVKNLFASLKSGGGAKGKFELNNPVIKLAIVAGMCWFVGHELEGYKQEALTAADQRIAAIEQEQNQVNEQLAKLKSIQPLKARLEADENTIRTKIAVLSKLIQSRDEHVRMLTELTKLIPSEVWLKDLKATPVEVTFRGSAKNSNQVAEFLSGLSGSSFFSRVTLSGIQQETAANGSAQSFELKAERKGSN